MEEIPKRLPPTRHTLRELYLKSGNRCAFPGCDQVLFNAQGTFVGQICHIEAAEKDGERFNKNQTNEQRRQSSNLLLMCYSHHVETNDVVKFTPDLMKKIKQEHEVPYTDVVGVMIKSVKDHTLCKPIYPNNLRKMNRILAWKLSVPELTAPLNELVAKLQKFSTLPVPTRQFFSILINKGHDSRQRTDLEVSAPVLQQAMALSEKQMREFLSILDQLGLIEADDVDDFGVQVISVTKLSSGWKFWGDLRTFCQKEGVELSRTLTDLDFGILDED